MPIEKEFVGAQAIKVGDTIYSWIRTLDRLWAA